jgi:hypothetical protein
MGEWLVTFIPPACEWPNWWRFFYRVGRFRLRMWSVSLSDVRKSRDNSKPWYSFKRWILSWFWAKLKQLDVMEAISHITHICLTIQQIYNLVQDLTLLNPHLNAGFST